MTEADASVGGVRVDTLATAVAACADVSGLYAGRLGEVGSYLPGRRVAGIVVDEDVVTGQVRASGGATASQLLTQISLVSAPLLAGHRLHVVVADIDDAPDGRLAVEAPPALPAG